MLVTPHYFSSDSLGRPPTNSKMVANSGFLYGYDMCYPTPLDPNMVVFKAGRSDAVTGPFQRLCRSFARPGGHLRNGLRKTVSRSWFAGLTRKTLKPKSCVRQARVKGRPTMGCFDKRKELFTHTSLEKIKEAMGELISEFGGEWLNYSELQEEHYLVDKLWDNISQFKNWVVSPRTLAGGKQG